ADVASAKKAADTYYQALNSFTLFSLELDSGMRCWWWTQHGNDDPDDGADFTPGNLIVFYAYDGKNEMPREITLGRTKAGADWQVINEGY
ncbi:MAG: hypothetical protein LBT32_02335, partial [Peptococcaceae bacterium]|nr:hypothetical protein [Peptococcaceae bacterium]